MLKIVNLYIKNYFNTWRTVYNKPRYLCNLEELLKKEEHSKHMMYTLLTYNIIMLSIIFEMFFYRNTASLTFDIILIISFIALYDEARKRENLLLFIYLKKQEILNESKTIY